MTLIQLDAATRAGAVVLILLLAIRLLSDRRQLGLPAMLFAPLAVCLSGFVVGNTPIESLRPSGSLGATAHVASGFTVIFLWWFCLACFDRRFRLTGGLIGIALLWAAIAGMDRGLFGDAFSDTGLSRLLVVLGFAIVAHLVSRLLAEREGDLNERRHDARRLVAVLLGGMLFIDLAADLLFGFAWRPLAFAMTQNIMVLAFGAWLAGRLLTVRSDILSFGVAEPAPVFTGAARPSPEDERMDALHRRLRALVQTEKIFLDPELTFTAFVERMAAPERAVRTLINHQLGHDHFRSFLNHYRVAEACRLLEDQGRSDEKLVAIALDSGFASLASFNRAFRAIAGCTPSEYRMAHREGGSAAALRRASVLEGRKAVF